ncbi:hypothetical protein PGLA_12275 [Paenibacillus glacialis]|uniref:Photosynthesis system II assembly factor Ycf48/Hcf136-like domain-containing protein n=2 Tax=Paenibacillus glacialis TaxID=494026 RepID=A0A168KTF7_9BACL|nr:hypothetical protein PGLA_12275 [Paenibacillus glacialis]
MKSRRHKYISIIILLGLLLTACSNNNSGVLESQPPEQEQEDLSELGQTLNVVPVSTPSEAQEQEQYQIQTRLVDFHLLNETTGLAWGLTRNSIRLYSTVDRGGTWVNISPAANVQFTANPKYGTDVFFIDKNNGWIVRNGKGTQETVVLRTTNGGLHWKISSLPKSDDIKGISFTTITRGWILTSSASSMGKEEKYLYRTDDGGANWKKIMQSTEAPYDSKDTPFAIPNKGYIMDMSFVDSLHGFVTLQDKGFSALYTTKDAGKSWALVPNFIDRDKMDSCSSLSLGNPEFTGDASNNGFIPLACTVGERTKFNGYFTSDKGVTWKLSPFDVKWAKGLNQMLSPVFLNNNEGWYLQESIIYHTINQGKTWESLPISSTLQKYIEMYPSIVKMEFISSKSGWILLENVENKRSLLLQTLNGGVSWKVL